MKSFRKNKQQKMNAIFSEQRRSNIKYTQIEHPGTDKCDRNREFGRIVQKILEITNVSPAPFVHLSGSK